MPMPILYYYISNIPYSANEANEEHKSLTANRYEFMNLFIYSNFVNAFT